MISVIIPVFNGEKYLENAVNCILNQTFKDVEILICDDGSTDGTQKIAKNLAKSNSDKIKYFWQKNAGVSAARNLGIRNVKGEFIANLDVDDEFMPYFLEKAIHCINENEYDFVIPKLYCHKLLRKDNGYDVRLSERKEFPQTSDKMFSMLFRTYFGCVKFLAKKNCFEKAGIFDERLLIGEDLELWIRFVNAGLKPGLIVSEGPLYQYLERSDSLTHDLRNFARYRKDRYFILKKHQKEAFQVDPSLKKYFYREYLSIGKELLKMKSNRLLGVRILLYSQFLRAFLSKKDI